MRVLIITSEQRWTNAIEAVLPRGYQISSWRAEEMDRNSGILHAIDVCFVVGESIGPATLDTIRHIQAKGKIAIFAVADSIEAEYEELAILAGARHVFKYPLRARLIASALERLPAPLASTASPFAVSHAGPVGPAIENGEVLAVLRDFSRLLPHAVNGPSFLGEYLRRLREVLRCSRLILYLTEIHSAEKRLKCVFASGVDARLFDAIRLTQSGGIPSLLIQRGSLIQRSRMRESVPYENAALRELEVFGAEFAVPLSAQDGFVGVLLVGARIAGSDYTESELTLLFHLMEELAAAVRNAELHADLLRERTTFSAVLQALPIGCLVLRKDHRIVHINEAMRELLGTPQAALPKWEDLPAIWASGAYDVLHRRTESFDTVVDHVIAQKPGKLRITVKPLEPAIANADRSVAITALDVTALAAATSEQVRAREHPLLPRIGASLANEFRNLFTPFHVLSQMANQGTSPEGMSRILAQLGNATQRIQRRIDNLAYLAPEALVPTVTTSSTIIRRAQRRLEQLVPAPDADRVEWTRSQLEENTTADESAVSLALSELVLNALEASSGPVQVGVHCDPKNLTLRVRNSGDWSAPRPDHEEHRPFVSTKNAVGIGLEVANRVAKSHSGALLVTTLPNNTVEVLMRIPRNPQFLESQ